MKAFKLIPGQLLVSYAAVSVLARDIRDLEQEIRTSSEYRGVGALCGQCAIAGNDNSGCWGSQSAVRASGCVDGEVDCFCDDGKLNETAVYVEETARMLCAEDDLTTPGLAARALLDWCEAQGNTTTEGGSPGDESGGSDDDPPKDPPLSLEAIAGIAASVATVLMFAITLFLCLRNEARLWRSVRRKQKRFMRKEDGPDDGSSAQTVSMPGSELADTQIVELGGGSIRR